jgi:hypothetical protein
MATPNYTRFIAVSQCIPRSGTQNPSIAFQNNYGFGYGEVGQYFCYEGEIYLIESIGGGGIININVSTFYATEGAAEAVCPCELDPSGEEDCQDTTRISEYVWLYYDENCSVGNQNVMFLNQYGVYDFYNFRARSDVGYDVQKQEYKEAPPLYTEGWNEVTYYGWNFEQKVWDNKQSKTGILHTGYIPRSDAYWLTQTLLRSPRVYLVDDVGDLEPIIVTNTEVILPNYQKLQQVEVVMEYKGAYNEIRQNR